MADTRTTSGTMKALVQEGRGSADVLSVRDVPIPELAEGRVLVRMRAASVNALDWHTTHGGRWLDLIAKVMRQRDDPVRGVELSGVVEAIGPGVTRFKPGDEVFGGAPAAFAELVRAREAALLPKPAAMSFEAAATIGVGGRTALQAIRDHAGVRPGQRVLIHGAGGGVGTYAVQIAKAMGASVTAVTGPRNVDLIRTLGADVVIDSSTDDVTRGSARFDAIIDIAATRSVASLRRILAPGGVFVQVGAAKSGGWFGLFGRIASVMIRKRMFRQRTIFFIANTSLDDLATVTELIVAGKVRPVIDRTYPLAEGREAVRYVGTGQARAKVVITG